MVKVLQILGGLGRGGMETFIMNVFRNINRDEILFDFLLRSSGGDYEDEAKALGAKIYYTGERNNGFRTYNRRLDVFFKNNASYYSAIHFHVSSLSSSEPLYYAKKYGINIRILHSHSSSISGSKFHYLTHNFFKLFVKSWATHYIGCSKEAIDWLYKNTGIYNKVVMIPNGISIPNYTYCEQKRTEQRTKWGLDEKEFVIGHVGRFSWIKNHKFLVDVFEKIQLKVPGSHLLLIGNGILFDEIKRYVEKKDILNKVLFLGERSDVNEIMQAMDALVMPSFYEGFPITLVEAQASGLLTVGSDTISKDVTLTDCMYFLKLDDGAEKWANFILKTFTEHKRQDTSSQIRDKGFDIMNTSVILQNLYTE